MTSFFTLPQSFSILSTIFGTKISLKFLRLYLCVCMCLCAWHRAVFQLMPNDRVNFALIFCSTKWTLFQYIFNESHVVIWNRFQSSNRCGCIMTVTAIIIFAFPTDFWKCLFFAATRKLFKYFQGEMTQIYLWLAPIVKNYISIHTTKYTVDMDILRTITSNNIYNSCKENRKNTTFHIIS